ncbi:Uncharacterised protein [Mycobacterium tuberculosis]|uniref:Uncharacterized protein n=1 Tax=Mycobacterium tuberculosis TaxID=1773 RepID=A0A916LFE9_MYCTX|nr:Uncharacterised protein [Mycobacterium tuberculosis]COZ32550.1 Uncharacterised protein [Mycobacterium tuberculosis]COZ92705.1 Uncharacterised protein [Mycobacterium tuberculosis]CPA31980.1 Uncharacterised protein [Mycobacterium tuberculosis]
MISPRMVIIASRDAELRAIDRFNGCSLAVIDSAERRTSRALSKPSSNPRPKNIPTVR